MIAGLLTFVICSMWRIIISGKNILILTLAYCDFCRLKYNQVASLCVSKKPEPSDLWKLNQVKFLLEPLLPF